MKLLKHIFSTFILFFTLSAYSASSDCVQLEEDGTINCIPATISFSTGNTSPRFATAQELIDSVVASICSTYIGAYECYAQYENHPVYPPPGREICSSEPSCGKYITYNPNSVSNQFFIVMTILRNTEPYYYTRHFQRSIVGYKFASCPLNTTVITNGGGDTEYTIWCKPTITQYQPVACDSGCNLGNGNASY